MRLGSVVTLFAGKTFVFKPYAVEKVGIVVKDRLAKVGEFLKHILAKFIKLAAGRGLLGRSGHAGRDDGDCEDCMSEVVSHIGGRML